MDLYTFLKRLPKVSLHVHLAGTVQPSTLVALASKNDVALPAYREPEDLYDYPDIYQFLKMFDLVIASVREREDFHRITYETLQQAAEHGVQLAAGFARGNQAAVDDIEASGLRAHRVRKRGPFLHARAHVAHHRLPPRLLRLALQRAERQLRRLRQCRRSRRSSRRSRVPWRSISAY